MTPTLTKNDLKTRLGLERDVDLAAFCGVTQSAVNQWGDGPVPEVRVLAAILKRPECFTDLLPPSRSPAEVN